MRMCKTMLTTVLILFVFPVSGQPYSLIEDTDVLAMQEEVLKQEYPRSFEELEILNSYSINDRYSKIAFRKDGIYHEAIMNSDRKDLLLVAIAVEMEDEQVPDIIKNALRDSRYGNLDIVRSFKVSTPFLEYFYAFEVVEKNTTRRVYFNELGVMQAKPY